MSAVIKKDQRKCFRCLCPKLFCLTSTFSFVNYFKQPSKKAMTGWVAKSTTPYHQGKE